MFCNGGVVHGCDEIRLRGLHTDWLLPGASTCMIVCLRVQDRSKH